jgi:hypothetical protein
MLHAKRTNPAPPRTDVARQVAAAFALLIITGWSVEAAAQPSARPVQIQENCTRVAPCTEPQGGVYFITPSGTRSYLPCSEAPSVRVQEKCTPSSPCIGPQGGRYHIPLSGTRRYMRRN